MDFIRNLLTQIDEAVTGALGDLGPLILVGGLGLLLVIVALPAILFRKKDPLDKLRDMQNGAGDQESRRALRIGGKDQRLDRFSQFLEPQDIDELSQMRLTLIRAGYRSKGAVQTFHFAQFALGLGFLALGSIYVLVAPGLSAQASIMSVL